MPSPLPLLVLTDRSQLPPGRSLVEQVGRCVDAGARWVCLRERDLPDDRRLALATSLAGVLRPVGGRLVVAAPLPVAAPWRAVADGVHLRRSDPVPPHAPLVGRSTHDAAELRAAAEQGCDYVTLSPFADTTSKPGYGPALGPAGLRRALDAVALGDTKVLALAGISPSNAAEAVAAGAHGVALMGDVMRAGDPGRVIRELLAALD
ncbi:thiamine phosphate synthase [Arsenicicoccus cauae]|uniref:Thiamine phosphate synthase n=1 Tax=Arsenicicoccus cauae TaxID=2663847 RepID=A0A6I3IVT7_9MICO|nr:thiamine phosphate synthase [Arsenicicoccus cauae]MTB70976.1 thiamine phosphate synthase [Arsenicicoccus cauae]